IFALAPACKRRSAIAKSLREAAQTSAATPSAPATSFFGMLLSKDCTAARSPSRAAVTSDISPAANAAPARIVEPINAARMVAFVFITLPLFGPCSVRAEAEVPAFAGTSQTHVQIFATLV